MVTRMPLYWPNMSKSSLNILEVVLSVLSSFIGIQSNKNRKRDFKSNSPSHFIIVGIILTLVFILLVYLLVNIALYAYH